MIKMNKSTAIKFAIFVGALIQSLFATELPENIFDDVDFEIKAIGTEMLRTVNNAYAPQFLDSSDLKEIIDKKGIIQNPMGSKVLLGSVNPETGHAYNLSNTSLLKTLYDQTDGDICATKLCCSISFSNVNATYKINNPDVSTTDFNYYLDKKLVQKDPKDLSDIKMVSGFDNSEWEPPVDVAEAKKTSCSIQAYRLHQSTANPDDDVFLGHIFLISFITLSNVDKEFILSIHKNLESMIKRAEVACC